jgi:nickel-type superoxide dismutase maturation protease
MEPTLAAGDWLLVDPNAYQVRRPQAGDLVVTAHPRLPARLVVKRVADMARDGSLRLAGDHPAHATELELAGVTPASLLGRAWFRYWPLARIGRVR